MDIQEVDSKKMEALNFLAQTNIKIGEARGLLVKLQEEETKYLTERELKALDRIAKVLDDSKAILDESAGNYEKVKELYESVSVFLELLTTAYAEFQAFQEAVAEKHVLIEQRFAQREEALVHMANQAKADKIKIDNGYKSLNAAQVQLDTERKKVASDRGAVEREIIRLKEGRI